MPPKLAGPAHHYLPFGDERPDQIDPTLNTRAFTGHERDDETGLDYMLARYYGSGLARFASPDPLTDTFLTAPQSWNKYSYVRNNPIAYIDPLGTNAAPIFGPGVTTGDKEVCKNNASNEGCTKWPHGTRPASDVESAACGGMEVCSDGGAASAPEPDTEAEASEGGWADVLAAPPWMRELAEAMRRPDYLSFDINFAIPTPWTGTAFGLSAQFIMDRNHNFYYSPLAGGNIGKAAGGVSGSLSLGWINQWDAPTPKGLKSFLTGLSGNFGGGGGPFFLGAGVTVVPGRGPARTSTEFGIFTPQLGGSAHYTWVAE